MNSQQVINSRVSSSICALRFIPLAEVELSQHSAEPSPEVSRRVLGSGILLHTYRTGVFIFDCEEWNPGKSVKIPSFQIKGGERLPASYMKADKEAFEHVVNRTQMLNCFLACLSTSISFVQQHGLGLGQEVSPTNYISLDLERGQIPLLRSVDIEQFLAHLGYPRPPGDRMIVLTENTIDQACKLLDAVLKESEIAQVVELLYRGCYRYSFHDFSLAAVIAWTVCEKLLNTSWVKHLDHVRASADPSSKMSKSRFDKLTGRDYSASIITEFHELVGLLPFEMYERLNAARQVRNNWMHKLAQVSDQQAIDALQIAQDMLNHVFQLKLSIQLSRSTSY